jgi:transcriptional regulator with XRE-family HTH domain
MDDSARPGARIAEARKALGLTQLELAARAGVGYGTLAKVETGHQAASSTWLGAVARALGVDVAYILGSPYLDTAEGKAALHQYIPPIRRALAAYNLLDAEDEVAPRSLAALTADVDQLGRWRRDTAYDKVGAALPGLIAELQRAAAELPAEDSHKAAALLANSYRAANTLAHKLGYVDLSLTAMERMERAAEKSADPLLVATADYLRAAALARIGDGKAALRLLHQQINNLDPWVTREGEANLASVAVLGALHMRAGVICAAMADADRSVEHLAEAARLAEWTGPDRVYYETTFGPVNVELHRLAAEVDLAHPGHAVTVAEAIHLPPAWPASGRRTTGSTGPERICSPATWTRPRKTCTRRAQSAHSTSGATQRFTRRSTRQAAQRRQASSGLRALARRGNPGLTDPDRPARTGTRGAAASEGRAGLPPGVLRLVRPVHGRADHLRRGVEHRRVKARLAQVEGEADLGEAVHLHRDAVGADQVGEQMPGPRVRRLAQVVAAGVGVLELLARRPVARGRVGRRRGGRAGVACGLAERWWLPLATAATATPAPASTTRAAAAGRSSAVGAGELGRCVAADSP